MRSLQRVNLEIIIIYIITASVEDIIWVEFIQKSEWSIVDCQA